VTIARVAPYTVPAVVGQFVLGDPVSGDFVFGTGTSYLVQEIDGLDLPAFRAPDAPRAQHHGSFGGQDTAATRPITFLMTAEQRVGDPSLATLLAALSTAFRPRAADVPLSMLLPGGAFALLSLGRPRKCAWPVKAGFNSIRPATRVVAMFEGLDPLLYSAAVQDAVIPQANAGVNAGMSFGVLTGSPNWPLGESFGVLTGTGAHPLGATFGSDTPGGGTGSGFYTAVNLGNEPTAPVTTIYGPVDTPWIQLVETGQVIQVNIVLGSADFLELDHDLHTVMLNGVSNRQSALDPQTSWFLLPAGSSTVHYRAVGAGLGSSVDMKWRHAKWSL
jgi:hypothetical protein